MSPCRYVAGNKEIGDIRVPWKLVKREDSGSVERDGARGYGQYLGNINELNREGYSHATMHSKHHVKKLKKALKEMGNYTERRATEPDLEHRDSSLPRINE